MGTAFGVPDDIDEVGAACVEEEDIGGEGLWHCSYCCCCIGVAVPRVQRLVLHAGGRPPPSSSSSKLGARRRCAGLEYGWAAFFLIPSTTANNSPVTTSMPPG